MASYWKSPYNETAYPSVFKDSSSSKEWLGPCKRDSLTAPRKTRRVKPITTEGWYEWAASLATKSSMFHTSKMRSNGGKIKGILKPYSDYDRPDTGKASLTSGSLASTTASKREKKKVTFGAFDNDYDGDTVTGWSKFRSDRSTSAHHNRLSNSRPMDEFAKQNLKKLLGYVPGSAALPVVSGKSMIATEVKNETSLAAHCKHSADLRCANCVPVNSNRNDKNCESTEALKPTPECGHDFGENECKHPRIQTPTDGQEADKDLGTENDQQATNPETKPKSDLKKKSNYAHWTKSFQRPPSIKNTFENIISERYPFSAGTVRRRVCSARATLGRNTKLTAPVTSYDLELHITGDGKFTGLKQNSIPWHRSNSLSNYGSEDNNIRNLIRPHGSATLGKGRLGLKIPATPTQFAGKDNGLKIQQIPKSAPPRIKPSPKQYVKVNDTTDAEEEVRKTMSLDKTSQILTWLKDVQQKRNYQPRNVRLYALEPQQLH